MKKTWMLKERYPDDIAREFGSYDDCTRQLLWNRGISKKEDAERFLNPDYLRDTHDPFRMKGMERAVDRILCAIEKKEKIIVFGDYDADGVCGAAVFADFFRAAGYAHFEVYNPDRFKEGYGLTRKALDALFEKNANLIITVDTGVTSFDEIADAEGRGINVIVIDHHLVPPKWPPAYAILDPRQEDETYPFTGLCGTGLAFKTVQAILKKNSFGLVPGWEKWLLDLVAIASVADMVPLTGENHALVYWGLEVMKRGRRAGLAALARAASLDLAHVSATDIGFTVAPRINVAGRMEHATIAGSLLAARMALEAETFACRLENLIAERKALVGEVLESAKQKFGPNVPPLIILGDERWQPGVLSIAANRFLETFACPVVLWGRKGSEVVRGSIRSDGTVSTVDWMREAGEDLFIDFGGHPIAGGFSVRDEHVGELDARMRAAYERMPKGENAHTELALEKEMLLDDVNSRTLAMVSRFEPCGMENPKPVFWFRALSVAGAKTFGNGGIHLEFSFRNSGGNTVRAVGFFTSDHGDPVKMGDRIDLAATLEYSTFRGYDELRLRIVDFKKI
ncbi:MAG: single-stranded-DNA-specific exonuclease RecJ [Candidatus Niyogibacteria bacterium]|nr:single-stranded-DNA-specific exonuclease RecJ [Candidatus Niyogibacteria bacterium]